MGSDFRGSDGGSRFLSRVCRHASDLQAGARGSSVILPMTESLSGRWHEVVRVVVELFVASYGSTASAAASMFLLYPLVQAIDPGLSFHQFNRVFSVPYFPVQIAFGFAVGSLGRQRFGTRFSLWIWTIPLLIFIWHLAAVEPSVLENSWRSRLDHFVGSACRPPACFDQIRYTAPLYTSVAYALGALARGGLKLKSRND